MLSLERNGGPSHLGLVPVFIETDHVEATVRVIEQVGGRVGARTGRILSARVPQDAIPILESAPQVVRIEAGRSVRGQLDLAAPAMQVDRVHAGALPLSSSVRGRGVIVGVIDSGLDLAHRAFQDAQGRTRIVSLWDQTATGGPPEGFSYGAECTRAAIEQGTCGHVPKSSHGTLVTGIAAGSQLADVPYVGIAPEADIVFVNVEFNTDDSSFSTSVCDATSYIFEIAKARGVPAVVNMSFGTQNDPHDGTSLASKCLDGLTGPGKIIVAAAGNEGEGIQRAGHRLYAHAGFRVDTRKLLIFYLGASPSGRTGAWSLWFDSGELSATVGLLDRSTLNSLLVASPSATISSPVVNQYLTASSRQVGPISIVGSAVSGGPSSFEVEIRDENGDGYEIQEPWGLEIRGQTARVDAFLETSYGSGFRQGGGIIPDSAMTIGYPAISANTLAVGSYVTRVSWAQGGVMRYLLDPITGLPPALGDRSATSSLGPARNTSRVGVKPEITAPGAAVSSAFSATAGDIAPEQILLSSPSGYAVSAGTSMSSPAVAGVAALLLSLDPQLDVSELRDILMQSADSVPGVTTLPNTEWGAGKVNALAAIAELCRRHDDGGLNGCVRGEPGDAGRDAARDPWDVEHYDASDASDTHDATGVPLPSDSAVNASDDGASETSDAGAVALNTRDGDWEGERPDDAGTIEGDRSLGDDASSPSVPDAQVSSDGEPAVEGGCGCRTAGELSSRRWRLQALIGLVWLGLVRRRSRLRPRDRSGRLGRYA